MVYTFLAAQGHSVGKSLLEEDRIELVRSLLQRATDLGVDIVLPTDIVAADPSRPTLPLKLSPRIRFQMMRLASTSDLPRSTCSA